MGLLSRLVGYALLWGLVYSALLAAPLPREAAWLLAPWAAGVAVGLAARGLGEAVAGSLLGSAGWTLLYLSAALLASGGRLQQLAQQVGAVAYLPVAVAVAVGAAAAAGARLARG